MSQADRERFTVYAYTDLSVHDCYRVVKLLLLRYIKRFALLLKDRF